MDQEVAMFTWLPPYGAECDVRGASGPSVQPLCAVVCYGEHEMVHFVEMVVCGVVQKNPIQ